MHIKLEVRWRHGLSPETEIDPGLFHLLRAVEKERALTKATRATGMSYRHAWGMLRRWEDRFRAPLVKLERGRGRGARLTDFGARLLQLDGQLAEKLDGRLESLGAEFSTSLTEFCEPSGHTHLRLWASHGIAVRQLAELLEAAPGMDLEFETRGSLDSLRALAGGQCDMAGFHFPLEGPRRSLRRQFLRWLDPGKHRLLLLASRQQGLMTAPGNPKRINGVSDLCKRSVRLINRQRGSGTRTILDALLHEQGIAASQISGYAHEEFTHDAVAAIVASGAVDAGFGIEAAAKRFRLNFQPVLREAYLLAFSSGFKAELLADITDLVKSRRYTDRMQGLPGYDIGAAGTMVPFEQLFGDNP